eukprot:TRINITY_DN53240_c0_g1_i2.p1 TRINITY_DN53240_c0_g1~~TRINITY_DN53240_c0_g1_i2.p1  ORF type:complete len:122 (-),score=8.34 TRINITY_DN53240_c0_g1_i2:88-453(-)
MIIMWLWYIYIIINCFFFLMIRRPPRSTQGVSSAASDVYKRQVQNHCSHNNNNLSWHISHFFLIHLEHFKIELSSFYTLTLFESLSTICESFPVDRTGSVEIMIKQQRSSPGIKIRRHNFG